MVLFLQRLCNCRGEKKRSLCWGNLTFSIFSKYKSPPRILDKVSLLLSFHSSVLQLWMDVKLQIWRALRFFMSMSYSLNLRDTLDFRIFVKVEKEERGTQSEPTVCLSATWLSVTLQHQSELIFLKMLEPMELSKRSADLCVPVVKITSDKWRSWRHTSAVS